VVEEEVAVAASKVQEEEVVVLSTFPLMHHLIVGYALEVAVAAAVVLSWYSTLPSEVHLSILPITDS